MSERTYSLEPIYVVSGEVAQCTVNFGGDDEWHTSNGATGQPGALGEGEIITAIGSITAASGLAVASQAINTGGSFVDGDRLRLSGTCITFALTVTASPTGETSPLIITVPVTTNGSNTIVRRCKVVVE